LKIGLLVIATNKYISFSHRLLASSKQHFLTNHEVTMFVFTNRHDVPEGTVRLEQEHLQWPGPTLMRYHIFLKHKELLSKMDYLFYSDADMLFVDTVGDEVLGKTVATIHPGFYNKSRHEYTYETRNESSAFIPPEEGFSYFAGGFNGGTAAGYLELAENCKTMIDDDAKKGLIAVWHDESYMNKYFSRNPPANVLSPSYCYPESANLPFKKRLLALDKNHHEMRFGT